MNEESIKVGYQRLSSSWIDGCEYDGDDEVLIVYLSSGEKYEVSGCGVETYKDFVNAKSHGTYFNQHLKKWFTINRV